MLKFVSIESYYYNHFKQDLTKKKLFCPRIAKNINFCEAIQLHRFSSLFKASDDDDSYDK